MKVAYSEHYNFNIGLLKHLHPFDGTKFKSIYNGLKSNRAIEFIEPTGPMDMAMIDEFLSSVMEYQVRNKNGILQALEAPRLPFISFSFLDRKILTPMRWAVAGTLLCATSALKSEGIYWNVSGGYHHAWSGNMGGFCIYNDIGICHQQLLKEGLLTDREKILIIDTDAHHGNGNAYNFMENPQVDILDVYNAEIYPMSPYTRDRVNIPVPLSSGTDGETYLRKFSEALSQLPRDYRMAFVVAGTDTLASDKLGRLFLSIDDVAKRELLTLSALRERSIPAVVLGGGGYSNDSAKAVIKAISTCVEAGF